MVGEVVVRHTDMGRPDAGQDRVREKLNRQHPVKDATGTTLRREVLLRRIARKKRSRHAEVSVGELVPSVVMGTPQSALVGMGNQTPHDSARLPHLGER